MAFRLFIKFMSYDMLTGFLFELWEKVSIVHCFSFYRPEKKSYRTSAYQMYIPFK